VSAPERQVCTLLLLDDADDVAVAVRDLGPGPHRVCDGRVVTLPAAVPLGHKAAVRPLPAGADVVRARMVIGATTQAVAAGEHVHTHNLASKYLPTFSHRGGEA
jgi:hypothetical protein